MRKKESYYDIIKKNSMYALVMQSVQILLGFILRKIFIDTLGVEFLGYNSVFSNILQLLNLADLGIGTAVTGFLYGPIAQKDHKRVSALLLIYKRLYFCVALTVLMAGLLIAANLNIIVKDASADYGYLRLLFLINLLGTVATYFLAYKRTYIIAEQKSFITLSVDTAVSVAVTLLQIISLFIQKDYVIYLILNISKNIVSNLICGIYYDLRYRDIYKIRDKDLIREYSIQIRSYTKDVFIDRIGASIYNGTSNIIISAVKGSAPVGFLANYTMISIQISLVTNQILNAIQATLGHFTSSTENQETKHRMFQNYFFIVFFMANFVATCFFLLVTPFISLWLGTAYILPTSTAALIAADLYLTVWMQFLAQFFVVYRLHRYDKWIILGIAVLNIFISFGLIRFYGINGVLIGTAGTRILCVVLRVIIISKRAFHTSASKYMAKIFVYFLCTGAMNLLGGIGMRFLGCEGITGFVLQMAIVCIFSAAVPLTVFLKTEEERFLIEKIKITARRN